MLTVIIEDRRESLEGCFSSETHIREVCRRQIPVNKRKEIFEDRAFGWAAKKRRQLSEVKAEAVKAYCRLRACRRQPKRGLKELSELGLLSVSLGEAGVPRVSRVRR
jgi:hypothetical protein